MRAGLIAISAALGILSSAALAADLPNTKGPPAFAPPPPPAFSWTGFYIGANIGYGWGDPTGSLTTYSALFGFPAAVAAGFVPSRLDVRPRGVIGGGQVGFNWQNGPWVLGVETDFQGSGIENTNTILFPGGGGFVPTNTTVSDRLNWFGTARARAGWLVLPNLLIYGTGGLAYGGVHENYSFVTVPPSSSELVGSGGGTRLGWAAGAGVEWKITSNISVKAEYLHIDLGDTTVYATDPIAFPGVFANYRFHTEDDIARVGVNYQFDMFAPPAPVVAKY
jgi:outer membrane immunogenic protein